MRVNVGAVDRVVRIVLGMLLLVAGVNLGSWWGLVGLVPLVSGLAEWCPVYAILGRSARRVPQGTAP